MQTADVPAMKNGTKISSDAALTPTQLVKDALERKYGILIKRYAVMLQILFANYALPHLNGTAH